MAEQGDKKTGPQTEKKPMFMRTMLILFGALALQMLAVTGMWYFSGGPADVRADGANVSEQALLDQPVEVLLVKDRFQNTRTGRTYLYDTEIYIITARRHEAKLNERLTQRQAQIKTDIAAIFRRAEPTHLLEFELSTLKRQLQAMLNEHLGHDENGEPYVQEVLVPKCMQFRADF